MKTLFCLLLIAASVCSIQAQTADIDAKKSGDETFEAEVTVKPGTTVAILLQYGDASAPYFKGMSLALGAESGLQDIAFKYTMSLKSPSKPPGLVVSNAWSVEPAAKWVSGNTASSAEFTRPELSKIVSLNVPSAKKAVRATAEMPIVREEIAKWTVLTNEKTETSIIVSFWLAESPKQLQDAVKTGTGVPLHFDPISKR